MSQDVTQWLDEIKTLRTQLAALQQERDEAFAESSTWRDRLNAEMQLRLRETELLRAQITSLEAAQAKGQNKAQSQTQNPARQTNNSAPPPAAQPETAEAESQQPGAAPPEAQFETHARESELQHLEARLATLTRAEDLRELAREVAQKLTQERDRFRQDLEQEQAAHQATRESLSLALGDAVDLLAHRKGEAPPESC